MHASYYDRNATDIHTSRRRIPLDITSSLLWRLSRFRSATSYESHRNGHTAAELTTRRPSCSQCGSAWECDWQQPSLFAATHARTLGRRGPGNLLLAQVAASCSNVLRRKDAEKHTTYDQYMTVPCYPFSFSSGRAHSPVCEHVFAHWKAQLGQTRWYEMLRDTSVCLEKYRARTYRFFTVYAA